MIGTSMISVTIAIALMTASISNAQSQMMTVTGTCAKKYGMTGTTMTWKICIIMEMIIHTIVIAIIMKAIIIIIIWENEKNLWTNNPIDSIINILINIYLDNKVQKSDIS